MAIKSIRIGPADNVVQYDDGEFSTAIETTEAIEASNIILGSMDAKNPPVDADLVVFRDSASGEDLVTCTMAQFKAFLKTYFDTIYQAI